MSRGEAVIGMIAPPQCTQECIEMRVHHHNHDGGKIIVIDSFIGINSQYFKVFFEIFNYFIFMYNIGFIIEFMKLFLKFANSDWHCTPLLRLSEKPVAGCRRRFQLFTPLCRRMP
jgi:hypothetical protein